MSDIKKMIYRVDLPFENFTQPIKTKGYALTLIAKNDNGIKVIKELAATLKSDELLTSCKLLNFDLLMQNRADVLIGSTGDHGEVFNELKWWWEYAKDYKKMVEFYDFLEIFTAIDDQERDINKRILELGHIFNVPVLAISNVELMKPNNERTIKKLPPRFQLH